MAEPELLTADLEGMEARLQQLSRRVYPGSAGAVRPGGALWSTTTTRT